MKNTICFVIGSGTWRSSSNRGVITPVKTRRARARRTSSSRLVLRTMIIIIFAHTRTTFSRVRQLDARRFLPGRRGRRHRVFHTCPFPTSRIHYFFVRLFFVHSLYYLHFLWLYMHPCCRTQCYPAVPAIRLRTILGPKNNLSVLSSLLMLYYFSALGGVAVDIIFTFRNARAERDFFALTKARTKELLCVPDRWKKHRAASSRGSKARPEIVRIEGGKKQTFRKNLIN